MYQPQTNQLIINEFQENDSARDLRRYLPEKLINLNKIINLWIVNLSWPGPMFKIFTSLNIILILAMLALSMFGLSIWMYPKYPDKVGDKNLLETSRKLSPLVIARQKQPPQNVNEVISNNLFRKEREEYVPPAQPPATQVAKIQKRPALPSPELSLRGVMLLNGTKIAILEGSYPVAKDDKTEKQPIKRKGYYIGDRIANYKISQIEKRSVTLNTPSGQTLNVKLIRRVPNMGKARKKKQPKIISTRTTVKKKPNQQIEFRGLLQHLCPGIFLGTRKIYYA